jgi:hypothetical protein
MKLINLRKMYFLFCIFGFLYSQTIDTEYVIIANDTVDVFSYQIPSNYSGIESIPLLVTFHQWGGNENSSYSTQFDEEANVRGWFYLSPYGGSPNNYNHQQAQEYVKWAIIWLQNNFLIDPTRIYMVGGSMGGAAGAIFANNHLDPRYPMIAATASGSGILDCERRFYEMDGNNSMIEWFGGTPEEVPFEYHRNSAVYFADSTQSMHYNLRFTPIYLDFGSSEPHRYHAEDLYNLLLGYNENLWIETEPSGGHGFSIMDEHHTCNWMEQFELTDNPLEINVNLDESSRAYWAETVNTTSQDQFIRLRCSRNFDHSFFDLYQFANSDSLIFHNSISYNDEMSQLTIENHAASEIGAFHLGLTGEDIDLIDYISVHGEIDELLPDLSYSIQDTIVWIDVPNLGIQFIHIEIYYGNTTSVEVEHSAGWNLVGLPYYVGDESATTLFPESIDGTLFSFDGAYTLSDTLYPGTGYWLRFESEGTTVLNGISIDWLTLDMDEGWNLITGISNPIDVDSILDFNEIIIPNTVYSYDESYVQAEVLEPGKGYWIRSTAAGSILISNSLNR